MREFFKFMFASMVGMLLTGILLIILFFMTFMWVVSDPAAFFGTKQEVEVDPHSVVKITFPDPIIDRGSKNPFENFSVLDFSSNREMGLNDILENLEKAKEDANIDGIFLNFSGFPGRIATLEEVRNALIDFKSSDKFIIAYSDGYSQGGYYLASVADEIYLNPTGDLEFKGLGAEIMFLKGTLDKLEIEAQIIRGTGNKFKSAVEPFMYEKMSEANREQTEKYLFSLWDHMLENIAESRGLPEDDLRQLADTLGVRTAADAVKYGLIDGAVYLDQVHDLFREKLSLDDDEDLPFIKFKKYFNAPDVLGEDEDKAWKIKDKVAVIYAYGDIQMGSGSYNTIGSKNIPEALREARTDDAVKAIVLRVNSPGGSALASEIIWREVFLAKEAKPLIVSMGDYAASGGYYIACVADKIYAMPNTLTGSIGVFGVIPNMGNFFKNKLGITFDGAKTSQHADFFTTTRAMTDDEYDIIQQGIDTIYNTFLTRVAEGRGKTTQEVDDIGQGRVWSGVDALGLGLVDELGGLEDAIAYAAEQADLDQYRLLELPEQKDPFEEFLKEMSGEATVQAMLKETLGEDYAIIEYLKKIRSMKGLQTRLPFFIDIN